MRNFFLTFSVCFFAFFAVAQPTSGFNPQRTWVFMVGVLEWADANSFPSFEKKGRVDTKIKIFFENQGVPSHQIVYLKDGQATTQAVREAFLSFLKKAGKDDVLFFYYCGHGYKNDAKKVCFANHKGADWTAEEIVRSVNANFAGKTAYFTADCCNSGGLAVEVQKYPAKNYTALTSVVPTDVSTGNWTFSNALLYGLQGQNFVDTDGNGRITTSELAGYIDEEMAIVEGQKAAYFVPKTVQNQFIATNVPVKKNARVGQRVWADYDGTRWLGFIIGAEKNGSFNVRFYSYTNNETDIVEAARLKPYAYPKNIPVGTPVSVYYAADKKWYPAKVIKKFSCLHFIQYDDYDSEWNEWVAPDNIKVRRQK